MPLRLETRKAAHRTPYPALKRTPASLKHGAWRAEKSSVLFDEPNDEEPGNEPLFMWEDEKTLIADLMCDGGQPESEDDQILQLVESIQPSFSMHSKELLSGIADNMVPAVKRVRQYHQLIQDQIDGSYSLGVASFEKACQSDEKAFLQQLETMEAQYKQCQLHVRDTLAQLKEACKENQRLWNEAHIASEQSLRPIVNSLKTLPARVEQSVVEKEKASKQIGTKDKLDKQKMMKTILGRLT